MPLSARADGQDGPLPRYDKVELTAECFLTSSTKFLSCFKHYRKLIYWPLLANTHHSARTRVPSARPSSLRHPYPTLALLGWLASTHHQCLNRLHHNYMQL